MAQSHGGLRQARTDELGGSGARENHRQRTRVGEKLAVQRTGSFKDLLPDPALPEAGG